jgi:fucose 4-O-acetylase-like acetyltransferase
MPLFFMVSGVLLNKSLEKKGLNGYIKNRFNTVFYPLLIWGFVRVTLQLAAGNLSLKHGSPSLYFYILADPRRIAPLWYLHALFCISFIYASIKMKFKLSALHNFMLGMLLYLVSGYVTTNNLQVGFFADIFKYYIFFAVGDLLSGILLSNKARDFLYSKKLLLMLMAPFALVQAIVMNYNIAHHNIFYVENAMPILFLFQGLLGCSFSIAFSFLLQKWNVLPALKTIGFHSLYVYCMHYIIIIATCMLCVKTLHMHNTLLLVGICWTAAVAIPILFYKLTTRFNMWWLFSLSKPKTSGSFDSVPQRTPAFGSI